MSNVRHITVKADDDGQRLDRWLKKAAPDVPFSLMQKLIRKGQVRIDGKRAKPDTRLVEGQDIRIPPAAAAPKHKKQGPSKEDADFMRSLVLYEDADVIALNKPSGLAVQGGTNTKRHIDGMLEALKSKDGVKPRLVHRLDKETSGVMLVAKSAEAARSLGKQFKTQALKKIYWALTTPAPEQYEGAIKAPLAKGEGADKERMSVDEDEGKYALTDYVVMDKTGDQIAFVAFWPKTGRTHQIRVHAQVLGCPILGDRKYGDSELVPEGLTPADRLHLHAARLSGPHPIRKGQVLDVRAPLPPELEKSWKTYGFLGPYPDDPFEGV